MSHNKILIPIFIILAIAVALLSYHLYENYPANSEIFILNPNNAELDPNITNDLNQFYNNIRFNHNTLSYFIESSCDDNKIQRVNNAFNILHEKIEIISFYENKNSEIADILIYCSKNINQTEENLFIAGEGGPTKIINSSYYPLIIQGKVLLYNQSLCEQPITELHEILHVFGFDHFNRTDKIMYPYVDCKQKIDEEMIETLKQLYSSPVLAEIHFTNASVVKYGNYINISIEIKNSGLINSNQVILEVYGDNTKLDKFELGTMGFGEGKSFTVSNLKLQNKNTKEILFRLEVNQEEYNKENNNLSLIINKDN